MERQQPSVVTEKLSKNNYRSWIIEMHAYFRDEGLWGVVSGKELRGEDGEWTKKDAAALSAIRSNCGLTVVRMIHNAYTAKDAWEALLRHFRTESNLENSGPFYQEKLNGTNYTTWEINMKNYLEAEGLWGVVIGEELRVEEHATTSEWTKKNAAALCALRINCNERIYKEMIDCCSTAKDAWEAFFTVFIKFASTSEISGPIAQEKLNEENFRTWRGNMKTQLEAQGLWGVVTGEELPGKCRQMGGKWTIKNAKALGAIRFHCSETVLPMINDVYIAKDAWETLLKRFRPPLGILPDPNNQGRLNCYPLESPETLMDKYRVIKTGNLYHLARKGINGSEIIMPENDYTALHVAVSAGKPKVVDYFLEHESMHASMVDSKKRTALALAAYYGKLKIVKKLVRKYPSWLFINDDRGNIPLLAACEEGHEDTTRFLYRETFKYLGKARTEVYEEDHEFTSLIRQYDGTEYWVILRCLESKMFGIALEALESNRDIMDSYSYSVPLQRLAETPITFWKQRVYKGINHIYTHDCALRIHRIMCKQISSLSKLELERSDAGRAMFAALKNGNLEFVTEIIKTNPNMMWVVDESNRDLLMCAIANRQEDIAGFMHGLDVWRGETVSVDADGCNLLHMAGKIAPDSQLSRVSGSALQMQRELQWFKEVENIVPDYFKESKNNSDKTPSDVFTEDHEKLLEKAEKWMKDTATSFSIVCALIITLLFAAAFTVPGGNDQTDGFPVYRHKVLFKIFTILVATSFSAASTSVMMFLGILTSRYTEKDFLISLPRKLMVGLLFLFISMSVMLFAFSIAIILMFKGKVWTIVLKALLFILIFIPIYTFVHQHLPLYIEIRASTKRRVFKKKLNYQLKMFEKAQLASHRLKLYFVRKSFCDHCSHSDSGVVD